MSIFDSLVSRWSLTPLNNQTQVNFKIDFKVRSSLHEQAVKMFFGSISQQQLQAFMIRCRDLYGEGEDKGSIAGLTQGGSPSRAFQGVHCGVDTL